MSPESRSNLLLLAYPRPYRRRHGTEIVTTLMELGGPDLAEAWHLVWGGVRQRFRVNVRRPFVLAAAVLTALIAAAFGAAAGSAIATATAAGAPSLATVTGWRDNILGRPLAAGDSMVSPALNANGGIVSRGVVASAGLIPGWSADEAKQRLAGQGWQVHDATLSGMPRILRGFSFGAPPGRPVIFSAERDGVTVGVRSDAPAPGETEGSLTLVVWPTTGAARPLILAGLIAGALGGWLFAAAMAYRARSGRRRVRTALNGLALLLFVMPASVLLAGAAHALGRMGMAGPAYAVHGVLVPSRFTNGANWHTETEILSVAGLLVALAALALTLIPARHPEPAAAAEQPG